MPTPKDKLRRLYDNAREDMPDSFEYEDFDSFENAMKEHTRRKAFYDQISTYYDDDFPAWDDFQTMIGYGPSQDSVVSVTPQKGSAPVGPRKDAKPMNPYGIHEMDYMPTTDGFGSGNKAGNGSGKPLDVLTPKNKVVEQKETAYQKAARAGSAEEPYEYNDDDVPYDPYLRFQSNMNSTILSLQGGDERLRRKGQEAKLTLGGEPQWYEMDFASMKPSEVKKVIADRRWTQNNDVRASVENVWKKAEEAYKKSIEANAEVLNDPLVPSQSRGTMVMYNNMATRMKTHDLQKLMDDAWDGLDNKTRASMIEDVYEALKQKVPVKRQRTEVILRKQAEQIARSMVSQQMLDYAVKMNAPKNVTDYFFRRLFEDNSYAKFIQGMAVRQTGSTGDMIAREYANSNFSANAGTKGTIADIASGVINISLDPITWASGGVGSAATKVAGWGIKGLSKSRFLIQPAMTSKLYQGATRVAQGAVGGSANFTAFEAGQELINQWKYQGVFNPQTGEVGDFDMGRVGEKALHGAATGAVMGMGTSLLGNVSLAASNALKEGNYAGRVAIKAGEVVTGTIWDASVLTASDMIENDSSFKDSFKDNLAMMAGFKVKGAISAAGKLSMNGNSWKSLFEKHPDMMLNKHEQAELESNGYGDIRELFDAFNERKADEDAKSNGKFVSIEGVRGGSEGIDVGTQDVELPANRYQDLLDDPNVSESVKAKIRFFFTGELGTMSPVMSLSSQPVFDENLNVVGYNVKSFAGADKNSQIVTSKYFKTKEDADKEVSMLENQMVNNAYVHGSMAYDKMAEGVRQTKAMEKVSKDTGISVERIREIVDKDATARTTEEHQIFANIDYVLQNTPLDFSSEALRNKIKKETDVDVAEAIAKGMENLSDKERDAVDEYLNAIAEIGEDVFAERIQEQENRANTPEENQNTFTKAEVAEQNATANPTEENKKAAEEARAETEQVVRKIADNANDEAGLEEMRQNNQRHQNGNIVPVKLKNDDEGEWYVKDGNVVMTADGSMVDKEQSDREIVVFNAKTGETKMIAPAGQMGVESMGNIVTPEQQAAQVEQVRENTRQQMTDDAQGKVTLQPGETYTLPDGNVAQIMAVDGNQVTFSVNGKIFSRSMDELQGDADAIRQEAYREENNIPQQFNGAPDEYKNGMNIVVDQNGEKAPAVVVRTLTEDGVEKVVVKKEDGSVSKVPVDELNGKVSSYTEKKNVVLPNGMIEGVPDAYENGMEVTIKDENGEDVAAVVMRRVSWKNGEFVEDENGNIIEYLMDGDVRHKNIDEMNESIVAYQGKEEVAPVEEKPTAEAVETAKEQEVEKPAEKAEEEEKVEAEENENEVETGVKENGNAEISTEVKKEESSAENVEKAKGEENNGDVQIDAGRVPASIPVTESAKVEKVEIPVDKNGNKDYSQVPARQAYEDIKNDVGDYTEEAIRGELDTAVKEREKVDKMKVNGIAKAKEKKEAAEKAEAKVKMWESILAEHEAEQTRIAEAERAEAERQEEEARRAEEARKAEEARAEERRLAERSEEEVEAEYEAKMNEEKDRLDDEYHKRQEILEKAKNSEVKAEKAKKIYGEKFDDNFEHPYSVEELVSIAFPKDKILWDGSERGVDGLKQAVGSNMGRKSEFGGFNSVIAKDGQGIPFWDFVHRIYENDVNQGENGYPLYGESEIGNALIDMFRNAKMPRDIKDYAVNNRIDLAERAINEEENRYLDGIDDERRYFKLVARENELERRERELFGEHLDELSKEVGEMSEEEYIDMINKEHEDYMRSLDALEEAEVKESNHKTETENDDTRTETSDDEGRGQDSDRETEKAEDVEDGDAEGGIGREPEVEEGSRDTSEYGRRDEGVEGEGSSARESDGVMSGVVEDDGRGSNAVKALEEAYKSGDKTEIKKAVDEIKNLYEQGVNIKFEDEDVDADELEDYEGSDPKMLAEQYAVRLARHLFSDDDADLGYIESGIKSDVAKKQKADGTAKEVGEAQRMMTEALVSHLNGFGVPISADVEEGQKMIDAERARVQMMSAETANERFNDELEKQIEGTLPEGHIYQMGMPSDILLSTGFPNVPIELSSTRLLEKSKQRGHEYELKDMTGLVSAIQNPVAVFSYGDKEKSQNVIVEIQHEGKNFVVGIHFNQNRRGAVVNDIRGLFPKDNAEWLNWITQGKLLYADKERIQGLINQQRTNLAEVSYLDLDSVAKILQNFENPSIENVKKSNSLNLHKVGGDSPVYYSNAYRAVEGVKQEKATPEQWLAMLQKNGGLKAGEDKWIGLSEWLKGQDKKSLTKDEVLDYIAQNKIEIEEVNYGSLEPSEIENNELMKELQAEFDKLIAEKDGSAPSAFQAMIDRYGDDFDLGFTYDGERLEPVYEYDGLSGYARYLLGIDENPIDDTRLSYTTKGLENKREIALVVPTVEPYNESDEVHFGDAGNGRAVAWVRFGDATDVEGNRVLVIDEIQSKRHQDGREKGYVHISKKEFGIRTKEIADKYGLKPAFLEENIDLLSNEDRNKYEELKKQLYGVPDAPFDKNWHELAMKRMLRYAAENGYDKVAWTTGEQQAERYDLGGVVSTIGKYDRRENGIFVEINMRNGNRHGVFADNEGNVTGRIFFQEAKHLSEIIGKEAAEKVLRLENGEEIDGGGLSIGGEGMKGFYDQMLPKFMYKYGKKWGVKTGEVELDLPNEADRVMHSVDVTPEMKESVMEGQPMFFKTEDGEVYGYVLDGKIYIDPRIATAETPIHEYTHLWTESLRKANPKAWEQLKKLMAQETDLMDYVKKKYPELANNEDALMDEVFAHYSGQRGKERLDAEMKEEMDKANGVLEKAKVATIFGKIKSALDMFWNMARDLFAGSVKGLNKMKAEDFADMAMNDLLNGFNPKKNNGVPASEQKTMMGMHNISEEKLRKVLKNGGFANPSVAVVDTRKGINEDYGAITLIPSSVMLEKQRGRNAGTWMADAWTPTYPMVNVLPGKGTEKAYKQIREEWSASEPNEEIKNKLMDNLRYFIDANDRGHNEGLHYQFLKEKGMQPEVFEKKNEYDKEFYAFLKNLSEETGVPIPELIYSEHGDKVGEEYGRLKAKRAIEKAKEDTPDDVKKKIVDDFVSKWKDNKSSLGYIVDNVYSLANRSETETDVNKTFSNAEMTVVRDENLRKEYEQWLSALDERLGMEEKLFAGYTPSGNRRYVANTLENASKLMNKGGQAGNFGWSGDGPFIAKIAEQANTLDKMRKNKDKLIGKDQKFLHEEARQHIRDEFFDLSQVLNEGYGRFDSVGEARMEEIAGMNGDIRGYLKREYGVEVSDEWMRRYNDLVNFIRNEYPVFYFETKFNRPVELWEFSNAIVPEGTSDDVVEGLKKAGVRVSFYDKNVKGDRERVTNEVADSREGIKFQKTDAGDGEREVKKITKQENGVLYHKAMEMQSSFMAENGRLPLEMGVFTDKHFVIVNNVDEGNIVAIRAFNIENDKNGTIDAVRRTLEEYNSTGFGESVNSLITDAGDVFGEDVRNSLSREFGRGQDENSQVLPMGDGKSSDRGTDASLDSGTHLNDADQYGWFEAQNDLEKVVDENDEREVPIVKADKEHGFANFNDAKQWAKKNIVGEYENPEVGMVNVSNASIDKFLSQKAVEKSADFDVHLSTLKVIPSVIENSVIGEVHEDRKQDKNIRDIVRLYGCIGIDGTPYRVKSTIKRYVNDNDKTKAYSYEVTEIELLEGEHGDGISELPHSSSNSIRVAKLVKNSDIAEKNVSEHDAEYMEAVESGDMKKVSDMVKETAKNAMPDTKVVDENGEPLVVYHGTFDGEAEGQFFVFKTPSNFSSSKNVAEHFSKDLTNEYLLKYGKHIERPSGAEGRIYSVYLDIKNPIVIDFEGSHWEYSNNKTHEFEKAWRDILPNSDEYDGVIAINISEGGLTRLPIANTYVVKDPKQIKSADPVTYDDNGNMIPLSERFNSEKDDVRYREEEGIEYPSYETRVERSKRLGYTQSQYDAMLQRDWDDMVSKANDLVDTLGVKDNVSFIESNEGLPGKKKHAKGWYDPKTDRVVVVLQNNRDAEDVEHTIFHEFVAHYGLRKLFGDKFDTFLDNVFNNADDDVRRNIESIMAEGKGQREATEEYMARLAEDGGYEHNQGFWGKIKREFFRMLRSIGEAGLRLYNKITDNELRYLLWRSYENMVNPGRYKDFVEVAKDVAMRDNLGLHQYTYADGIEYMTSEDADMNGIRYRDVVDTTDKVEARESYERMLSSSRHQFSEAMQDSMLSLKKLYQAILGKDTRIEDVSDRENAYLAENRMSSMSASQIDVWNKYFMKPIIEAVHKLTKGKKDAYDALTDYMMAKHGLERNDVMARRDANKKYDEETAKGNTPDINALIDQNRQKDYAGLTALTGEADVADAEAVAKKMVDDYEASHDTKDIDSLWDNIGKATRESLKKSFASGMMSYERYQDILNMFQYYIPLQGFDKKVAEETYAYLGSDGTLGYGTPIRAAKGRKSKADDPIATIQMNGEASIRHGNRNVMKQRFLNFVQNHPSDLVSVQDVWLKKNDVTGEWEQYSDAGINDNDSPEEVERKTREFTEKMEGLSKSDPEHYKRSRENPNIPYRVVESRDKNQHQVKVSVNGKSYILTINGNPRAAQALNGLTNPNVQTEGSFGQILNIGERLNRWMAPIYTTLRPDFMLSNFLRDTVYANTITWVKEDPNYAWAFNRNFGKLNPVKLGKLYKAWGNGSIRNFATSPAAMGDNLTEDEQTQLYFYEFMMNGGETGWTNLRDIEKHKKEIAKMLKSEGNKMPKRAVKALASYYELANKSIENCARFAAFVTSREMGRSVGRSIWDSKEVSVNFNKKYTKQNKRNVLPQTTIY